MQNLIGDEVVPTKRTTPEAPDLQAILATAVERGVDAVSMEVSSHALALSRTAGIRFEAAAFLNLTQDHLDFHADFEDYFEAKAKLFTPAYTRRAVVNVEDPYGREIAARCREQGVDLHTFSISGTAPADGLPPADWTVEDVELGPDGSAFTVVAPDGLRIPGSVRLPGPFNVANALAAVVLLAAAGIDPATAAAGVGDVRRGPRAHGARLSGRTGIPVRRRLRAHPRRDRDGPESPASGDRGQAADRHRVRRRPRPRQAPVDGGGCGAAGG